MVITLSIIPLPSTGGPCNDDDLITSQSMVVVKEICWCYSGPNSVDFELIKKIILGGPDLIRQKSLKKGLGPFLRSETLSPSHFEEASAYEFHGLKESSSDSNLGALWSKSFASWASDEM